MLNILIYNIFSLSLYKKNCLLIFAMAVGLFVHSDCMAQVDIVSPFHTIGTGYNKSRNATKKHLENDDIDDMTDCNNMIKPPIDSMKMYVPMVALPLKSIKINSPFGIRKDPMNRQSSRMHSGLDLKAKYEEVYSMLPGVVTVTSYSTNGGYYITVNHGACVCSYLHLSKILIRAGQRIRAGQVIAISGNTGRRTTGPHLHISCRWGNEKGKLFNPVILLKFVTKQLSNNN